MEVDRALYVLGRAVLAGRAKPIRLERRAAALLTHLTLEGQTSRAKLAGLLWPNSDDSTARNNLVQSLRRLRRAAGAEVVVTGDALRASPALTTDVTGLNVCALEGRDEKVLKATGELLPFSYDDLPAFAERLSFERERLAGLRRDALGRLARASEAAGDYAGALGYAAKLLALDP